ncbi:MAG: heat shock protein HtpX [Phycisphaerales bacterium]|nr:heat shock protein HtpX [Phycisphaerales bacterium]
MARLQLIFPLLFWAIWRGTSDHADWQPVGPGIGLAIYLGGLAALVSVVFYAARLTMRRTSYDRPAAVPRFHRALFFARWMILLLHAFALWSLSYGEAVLRVADGGSHLESLPAFISIIPVLLAWTGLIWAQYPLDRAVREQNALWAVEMGEPVRLPPTLLAYVAHGVRSQVLFTLTPLVAIAFVRDGLAYGADRSGWVSPANVDLVVTVISVAVVFSLSPELLRRVLPTEPLAPSAVRDRLEVLSRRLKLGVREILLWHTHHAMGNAAVMGVLPGVRYVLISDLLLETMTPDQLEAVFAHEAGHVKHRHIPWYIFYWLLITVLIWLASSFATGWPAALRYADGETIDVVVNIVGILAGFVLFGLLSRGFERQADLFAARQLTHTATADAPARDGTQIFNSALGLVARLNNLPLDHRSLTAGRPLMGRIMCRIMHHAATWLHGSIRSRMNHLTKLANDPDEARWFDTVMLSVRWALAVALAVSLSAAIYLSRQGKQELNLNGGVQRQSIDAHRGPRVSAGFAENLGQ